MSSLAGQARQTVGHYSLHGEIGGGGMATVHFGRMVGALGFTRTVAIKRLHRDHVRDPHFVTMFMDEARLAARVRHPNVVETLDVVLDGGELFLVLEYVHGVSISRLMRAMLEKKESTPPGVACAIVAGVLHGLHAAHEATDETGAPLDIVHRDVSPQNVLVGADGIARVLDFGVAKAAGRKQHTREGQLKGKLAYMAPEQVTGVNVTRRCDVFAASIVLWEMLAGQRLFRSETESETIAKVMGAPIAKPSSLRAELAPLDDVVLRGLDRDQNTRFATAREMARALEKAIRVASSAEVAEWVESLVGEELAELAERVSHVESEGGRIITVGDLEGDSVERSSVVAKGDTTQRLGPTPERASAHPTAAEPVRPSPPSRPPSTPLRKWAPLTIAVVLGSIVGVVTFRERHASETPIAEPSIAPATAESIAPASAGSSPAPTVADTALDLGDLPETAPTDTHRTHVRPASHPTPPASASAAPAPSASASPPLDCNPPYYVDDQGHKHYKPACYK